MANELFIPEMITVHMGEPNEAALNITVPFPEYIKNVASSELYPTWPENALKANIYAIITFALNRIFTKYYRSKGYPFDITNSTKHDMSYAYGRNIYDNINSIVDNIFNSYIKQKDTAEPFLSAFCSDGSGECKGLSQWGTVRHAQEGLDPINILSSYYGNDIEIVPNAPVNLSAPLYPGEPLAPGAIGNNVIALQIQLNRISRNYTEIPKISDINGVYGHETEDAVREFQRIFDLPQTGIVNEATWYKIGFVYSGIKRLTDIYLQMNSMDNVNTNFIGNMKFGDMGDRIRAFQYCLSIIRLYYETILPLQVTGLFDEDTEHAVKSFQQTFGLPQTGIVDRETWDDIKSTCNGIAALSQLLRPYTEPYPGYVLKEGSSGDYVGALQRYLAFLSRIYQGIPPVTENRRFGPLTKASVKAFQKLFGLPQSGAVDKETWNRLTDVYSDIKIGFDKQSMQYPGYVLKPNR